MCDATSLTPSRPVAGALASDGSIGGSLTSPISL